MKIENIVTVLRQHSYKFQVPLINQIMQEFGHDAYLILIACLLSLRARDVVTIHVCRELFSLCKTPQQVLDLPLEQLEKILHRTGYFKVKSQVVRSVSFELINRFNGKVPSSYQALISIKGVGPKTANLVMGMAFGVASICVDTHVHRISNRLGIIKTSSVEKTETALKSILPQNLWIEYNKLLVMWGQNVCTPQSPRCSSCPLKREGCLQYGVKKFR